MTEVDIQELDSLPPIEVHGRGNVDLRQLRVGDSPDLFALIQKDRAYLEKTAPAIKDIQTEHDLILRIRNPNYLQFGILKDNLMAGVIILYQEEIRNMISIGYWIGEDFAGQGVMSEAAEMACDYGFSFPHVEIIRADCMESNAASARVLEKNGFKHIGDDDPPPGETESVRIYELTKEDYLRRAQQSPPQSN